MRPFAEELGYADKPFIWDVERRARIRAELDAAFFHLYLPSDANGVWLRQENESDEEFTGLCETFARSLDAVDYILESFPITKRKEIAAFGEYRTKRLILEEYVKFAGN